MWKIEARYGERRDLAVALHKRQISSGPETCNYLTSISCTPAAVDRQTLNERVRAGSESEYSWKTGPEDGQRSEMCIAS